MLLKGQLYFQSLSGNTNVLVKCGGSVKRHLFLTGEEQSKHQQERQVPWLPIQAPEISGTSAQSPQELITSQLITDA